MKTFIAAVALFCGALLISSNSQALTFGKAYSTVAQYDNSPNGPVEGNAGMLVYGTGIFPGVRVYVAGVLCPSVQYKDQNYVWCIPPAHAVGTVDVRIVNSNGASATGTAAYTYLAAPAITAQPVSLTRAVGASATFSVTASGGGLSYQWRRNGVNISGANSRTYSIASVASGSAGTYSVAVNNLHGPSRISANAALTVSSPTPTPAPITFVKAYSTVALYDNLPFGPVEGNAGMLVHGTGLVSGVRVYVAGVLCPSTQYKDENYVWCIPPAHAAGTVDVRIVNPNGAAVTGTDAYTYIAAPAITAQPVSLTRAVGASATFSVTASGGGLSYQWRRNAVNIAGANSNTYTISSVASGSAGAYSVAVNNLHGPSRISANATLTVGPAPTPTPRPSPTPIVSSGPTFPRIGGYQNGSPHNYWEPAYQQALAKQDVMVLAYWPGWGEGHMTMEQVVRNIKAINPNAKVFLYNNMNEISKKHSTSAGSFYEKWLKLSGMKWFAYARGTTTPIDSSFGDGANAAVNSTTFTPKDSSGRNWIQWHSQFVTDVYYKPNPSIDGLFMDNVFWKPRINADWNRDGVTDSQDDPTVQRWYRLGYRQYNDLIRTLMPGKLQIGNTADLPVAQQRNVPIPEYEQMLNGGALEGMIGKTYAPEYWGSWQTMMKWYKRHMEILAPPKLGIFHASGTRTEYQTLRYSLGSCLLGDGYFYYEDEAVGYSGVVWFDEYNYDLGRPTSAPYPATAYQNGVYRRDFERGIVLVNPKGNGPRKVTLERTYRKLSGTQAPLVNNGATVNFVDLKDRDGIILRRQ